MCTIGSVAPIRPVRPRESALALRLVAKPWARTAASTASRVFGETSGRPLRTRETVAIETPAASATSRIVARACAISPTIARERLQDSFARGRAAFPRGHRGVWWSVLEPFPVDDHSWGGAMKAKALAVTAAAALAAASGAAWAGTGGGSFDRRRASTSRASRPKRSSSGRSSSARATGRTPACSRRWRTRRTRSGSRAGARTTRAWTRRRPC